MTRYFLDTNCLVGMSFTTDGEYENVKKFLDTNNSIIVSELVIYEYCSRQPEQQAVPTSGDIEIDTNKDQGVFGKKMSDHISGVMNFRRYLRNKKDTKNEVSIDECLDCIKESFSITDPRNINRIKRYLKNRYDWPVNFDMIAEDIVKTMENVISTAEDRKEYITSKLNIKSSIYTDTNRKKQLINNIMKGSDADKPDKMILVDLYHLKECGVCSHFVTGDSGILERQESISNGTGISVMSTEDRIY